MPETAPALRHARILVTNDDGIHAPGLAVLEAAARSLSDDVWVVAPEVEQSATSHSLTTRRPLRIRRFGERRLSVDGTPTDCVLIAVKKILADRAPDLVLSGVNHGANLAEDIGYSGTVAAAMEAAFLGLRAIAFSQVGISGRPVDFSPAEAWIPRLVERLYGHEWRRDRLVNVNFPPPGARSVEEVRVTHAGRRDVSVGLIEGHDPGGRPYVWIGEWGADTTEDRESDLAAVEEGAIAVTPLHLDLSDHGALAALRERFR
jgi:5'-nucleotidase